MKLWVNSGTSYGQYQHHPRHSWYTTNTIPVTVDTVKKHEDLNSLQNKVARFCDFYLDESSHLKMKHRNFVAHRTTNYYLLDHRCHCLITDTKQKLKKSIKRKEINYSNKNSRFKSQTMAIKCCVRRNPPSHGNQRCLCTTCLYSQSY